MYWVVVYVPMRFAINEGTLFYTWRDFPVPSPGLHQPAARRSRKASYTAFSKIPLRASPRKLIYDRAPGFRLRAFLEPCHWPSLPPTGSALTRLTSQASVSLPTLTPAIRLVSRNASCIQAKNTLISDHDGLRYRLLDSSSGFWASDDHSRDPSGANPDIFPPRRASSRPTPSAPCNR